MRVTDISRILFTWGKKVSVTFSMTPPLLKSSKPINLKIKPKNHPSRTKDTKITKISFSTSIPIINLWTMKNSRTSSPNCFSKQGIRNNKTNNLSKIKSKKICSNFTSPIKLFRVYFLFCMRKYSKAHNLEV